MPEVVGSAAIEITPDFSGFERELTKGLTESIGKLQKSAASTLKIDVQLDKAAKSAKNMKESISSINTNDLAKLFAQLDYTLQGVDQSLQEISKSLHGVEEHEPKIGKLKGAFEELLTIGGNISQIVDAATRVNELTTKFTLLANLRSKVIDFFKGFKDSSNDASTASMGRIDTFFTRIKKGFEESSKDKLLSPEFTGKSPLGMAKEVIAREPGRAPTPVTQRITEQYTNEQGQTVTSIRTITTETIGQTAATKSLIGTINESVSALAKSTKARDDNTAAIRRTIAAAQGLKNTVASRINQPSSTLGRPLALSTPPWDPRMHGEGRDPVTGRFISLTPEQRSQPYLPSSLSRIIPNIPAPRIPQPSSGTAASENILSANIAGVTSGLAGAGASQAETAGKNIAEKLKSGLSSANLKTTLSGAFDGFKEGATGAIYTASSFGKSVEEKVVAATPEIKTKISGLFDGVKDSAQGVAVVAGMMGATIGDKIQEVAPGVSAKAEGFFEGAKKGAQAAVVETGKFAKSIQGSISASGAVDTVKGKFNDVAGAVEKAGGGINGVARTLLSGFGGAVKVAGNGITGLANAAAPAASHLGAVGNFATGAAGGLGKLVSVAGSTIEAISGMSGGMAALAATGLGAAVVFGMLAVKIGKDLVEKLSEVVHMGIEAAASMEDVKFALQGAFQTTAAGATEAFKQIDELSTHSIYTVEEMTQSVIGLKGAFASLESGDAAAIFNTIASAGAALGASKGQVESVVGAITEIGARSKVSSLELNRISNSIPGLNRIKLINQLSDALGLTVLQVQKLAAAGDISSSAGIAAILKVAQDVPGASGALDKQASTFSGMLAKVKNEISTVLGDAFKPLLDSLKGAVSEAGVLLSQLKAPLQVFAKDVGIIFKSLAPIFGEIVIVFANVVASLMPSIALLAQAFGVIVTPVGLLFVAVSALLRMTGEVLQPVVNVLQWLIDKTVGLISGLVGLASHIPLVGSLFSGLTSGAKDLAGSLEGQASATDKANKALADTPKLAIDVNASLSKIGTTAAGIGTVMVGFAQDVADAIQQSQQKTAAFDPFTAIKASALAIVNSIAQPLDIFTNAISAAQAAKDATQSLIGANRQLYELDKQRSMIQADVTAGAREEFEARQKIVDIQNNLRDLAQQQNDLTHNEQNRIRDFAPTLAKMDDDQLSNTVALDKAKWDIVDAQKALNAAARAALIDQKVAVTIAGLSTADMHARLAGVKASLAAQQPLVDFAEKQATLQDNLTTAQISQRAVERSAVTIPQQRAEFLRQSLIDQRTYSQQTDAINAKEKQGSFDQIQANLQLSQLLSGQTGTVNTLRLLNIQISDAQISQQKASTAVAVAEDLSRIAADAITGDYKDILARKIDIAIKTGAQAGLEAPVTAALTTQVGLLGQMQGVLQSLNDLVQRGAVAKATPALPVDPKELQNLKDIQADALAKATKAGPSAKNADELIGALHAANMAVNDYNATHGPNAPPLPTNELQILTDANTAAEKASLKYNDDNRTLLNLSYAAKAALDAYIASNPAVPVVGAPTNQAQVQSIVDQLNKQLHINIVLPPYNPNLNAEGSILTRATPVIAGEAGIEAILPLTKPARLAELLGDTRVLNPVLSALATIPMPGNRLATLAVPGTSSYGGTTRSNSQTASNERFLLAKAIASELAAVLTSNGNSQVTVNQTVQHTDPLLVSRLAAREITNTLDNMVQR